MLLRYGCAATYRIDCLQAVNRGGGKQWGVAIGPEPCSLSFRSAQSRISSLTEMLLSLCQIRSRCYTHATPQHAVNWTDSWEMEAFIESFPLRDREQERERVDFPTETESRKALLQSPCWPLQKPLWKRARTLLFLLYRVFITADQETPEANSSQGMFPLLPGGRAEQSRTLPESRGEHYVNHKAPLKLKKPSAAAFRGHKRPRAREITWSPISRYGLRTVHDGYSAVIADVLLCFSMVIKQYGAACWHYVRRWGKRALVRW